MWYTKLWLKPLPKQSKIVWTVSHDPGVWYADYNTARTWRLPCSILRQVADVSVTDSRSLFVRGITRGSAWEITLRLR